MKLDKTNVCVKIVDEAHLQQARELLEMYGERLDKRSFDIGTSELYDRLLIIDSKWCIGWSKGRTKITLTELEEILKGEKDA